MNIKVNNDNPNISSSVPFLYSIPCGFFMGDIEGVTGLFYKSFNTVCLIGDESGAHTWNVTSNCPILCQKYQSLNHSYIDITIRN